MRIDVERYNRNELYLLKDGSYILITDMEPFNGKVDSYHKRRVSFIKGKVHVKGNFDNSFPIEIGDINTIIDLSTKGDGTATVGALDSKVATYLGKLNSNVAKKLGDSFI